MRSNDNPHLATGGAWHAVREGNGIGIALVVEPLSFDDIFLAKVPEMSYRPAEGCQSKLQSRPENFEGRSSFLLLSSQLTDSLDRMKASCRIQLVGRFEADDGINY